MPAIGNAIGIPFKRGGGVIIIPPLPSLSTPSLTDEVFSPEQINLAWSTVSDVVSWRLEWSPNGINTWTQIGGVIAAGTLIYSHTGLTPGTPYYYRLTAVADGVINSDSAYGTDYNTTAAYLTVNTLGSGAAQYNSNKGLHKTAASGWSTWQQSGCLFNELLGNGDQLIMKVDVANAAGGIILADTLTPNPDMSPCVNVDYGIYFGYGLTAKMTFYENSGMVAGEQTIANGNLLRLSYFGSLVKLDYSTNSGVSWTNHKTSTVQPSGLYYILMDIYSQNGGFSELYIIKTKSVGKLSTNQVWLFAFMGESNSGGYAVNADLSVGELAARSSVQIWNNTTNAYENLDVGTNNLISHAGIADNATHGWENGLAIKVEDGTLPNPVYLAKCGQGGSHIADWDTIDAYYTTMIARIKANINAIVVLNKKPRLVIWISIGVNDILDSNDEPTWKTAVQTLFINIRNQIGLNTLIVFPYLMTSADVYNDSIQDIADTDVKTETFDTTNLTTYPKRDTYHWDSVGMRNMANAMVISTLNYFGI